MKGTHLKKLCSSQEVSNNLLCYVNKVIWMFMYVAKIDFFHQKLNMGTYSRPNEKKFNSSMHFQSIIL